MKNIIPALFVYFIVCVIVITLPASNGYNTVGWKLFVGQVYAILFSSLLLLLLFYVNKNRIKG